jgi:NADH:ubiquinone oxidoreductase subunit 2 (subunit N)
MGLSAHALAAGCLPQLLPLLLVLPLTLLAVRASDTYFARRSLLLRGSAAQLLVHVALSVATSCAAHPAASQEHVQPAADLAMTAAHVVGLVLMMSVAAQVERSVVAAMTSAATWVLALVARCDRPRCIATPRRAVGYRRAGFVPSGLVHRRCGVTRGPPATVGCPIAA